MIEIIQAVILGLVEGLTEFIPVSSTGHLIIVGHLLGLTDDNSKTFEIFIQLGAILAVVVFYRERFIRLFRFKNPQTNFDGVNGIRLLVIVTIPALILGYITHDFIQDKLFRSLTVAIGLAVGGVAILLVERFSPKPEKTGLESLTWRDALIVGLFQCISLWPGSSRSAWTIMGGMLYKIERKTAAEFSFFASVPVIFAATAYQLLKSFKTLQASDFPMFAVGFIVAFIAALFAIKYFIRLLGTITLVPFGWYRLALALVIVVMVVSGYLV